ncbi:MAG: DUF6263 family protein [Acidobacteriota bacterium]
MRRTLLVIMAAAASSCGGSNKQPSTTPPPPLAETKPEPAPEPKPEAKPEVKPEPPKPAGPLDVTVSPPKTTVKLVTAGKGKKVALKLTPKQGVKQQVELALDFSEKQTAPPELGGESQHGLPTVVLSGDAEVKTVDDKGKAEYQLTVSDTDVRDAANATPEQKTMSPKIKEALQSLKGMTIGGTIDANGSQSDVKLHVDKGDEAAQSAMELIRVALPWWPLLPNEPVGVGAKWQVTTTTKLMDKVDVTQTTDYELVAHKGNTWQIKGTTKVSGTDQDLEGAKISQIGGTGNVEVAMVDGALYPTIKGSVATGFTATATGPDPADPSKKKTVSLTFNFAQGTAVTPKP